MTETGERLETVRIANDPEYAAAGDGPGRRGTRGGAGGDLRLVLGGGRARPSSARTVHLAHPLGVKVFAYRRVKNDRARRRGPGRPAADGPAARGVDRPAGHPGAARAGAAPGQAGRAALEPEVPGPRGAGQAGVAGADERPVRRAAAGSCSTGVALAPESRARVDSLLRLIDALDFEIDAVRQAGRRPAAPATPATGRSSRSPGSGRCWPRCSSPRSATSHRFRRPAQLASLGRADPETPRVRHHRAPRPDHQAGLAAGALGRGRGRAARRPRTPGLGQIRDQVAARRGRNIGVVAAARELTQPGLLRAARRPRPRPVHRRAPADRRREQRHRARGGRGSCWS